MCCSFPMPKQAEVYLQDLYAESTLAVNNYWASTKRHGLATTLGSLLDMAPGSLWWHALKLGGVDLQDAPTFARLYRGLREWHRRRA